MKIRTGFVSNSSSSSFVIAVSEPNKCPHCGRSDSNIIDIIDKSSSYDNGVLAEGKIKVIEELKEWYEYEDEISEETKKVFKKINDVDISKKSIYLIEISNHDETLRDLLYDTKNVEVLHTSGY